MRLRSTNDQKKFKIGDAEFSIRVLDRKTYSKLLAQFMHARETAKTNTVEERHASEDALNNALKEFVRAGVSGHSGIERGDGSPFAFLTDEQGVAPEIVAAYEDQGWIPRLGAEVINVNGLNEGEIKN